MKNSAGGWLILFSLAACATGPHGTPNIGETPYRGHGSATVDTATVQSFAPQSLPPATARFVQNILEINSPGMGLLSPGDKQMYFTWSVSGLNQVWRIDGPLRFPVQLTSGPDPTSVVDFTADGKYLIVSRDHAGEEDPGLYLLPAGGGPLIEVQHKKGARTLFAWGENDGDLIYYMSNDIKPESYALYSYRISTGKRELLFSEPGSWFVADVWGDRTFLLGRRTGARTREYYEWSATSQKLVPVIGQNESEEYQVSFGVNPGEYFVVTAKFGEFNRLYAMNGAKLTPITPDKKMEIDDFAIDHRRFRMYVTWNDHGLSRMEVRDPHTFEILATPEIKNGDQVYPGRPSRLGRYITVGVENGQAPRTSYVFDWKERSFTQWVRPSIPEVDATLFVSTKIESFTARDGTKVPMLVTRPHECAADPCPVVVHFHGGPESQSRPGFNKLAQIFAGAGFVFVDPNVRGSEGYGKAWRRADDGVKRLEIITDIEDCANYIRKEWSGGGPAPKIGVMGWSYGGYSTLLAMTKFAGAYDAGVSLVGMSNLKSFLNNTAPYRRALRISEYGDPEKDAVALEQLSPTTYLNRTRAPLMIVQGVSDPRVPVGEAIQIHDLLKSRGIEAGLILFPDEGHGSQKRDNRVLEVGHTLQFFQKHLLR